MVQLIVCFSFMRLCVCESKLFISVHRYYIIPKQHQL